MSNVDAQKTLRAAWTDEAAEAMAKKAGDVERLLEHSARRLHDHSAMFQVKATMEGWWLELSKMVRTISNLRGLKYQRAAKRVTDAFELVRRSTGDPNALFCALQNCVVALQEAAGEMGNSGGTMSEEHMAKVVAYSKRKKLQNATYGTGHQTMWPEQEAPYGAWTGAPSFGFNPRPVYDPALSAPVRQQWMGGAPSMVSGMGLGPTPGGTQGPPMRQPDGKTRAPREKTDPTPYSLYVRFLSERYRKKPVRGCWTCNFLTGTAPLDEHKRDDCPNTEKGMEQWRRETAPM